ncbi:MAG: hypothetical protein CM1200mP10_14500 [Candidatus Neomarinimicrobiota bacterium]|nr:MAG: hypothetical protein CM1200mP10_14500 [Candidatus Neomarinimicrobiota bacterium]
MFSELNKIRAIDDLGAYTTKMLAQLQHERYANLFIQGRRLQDMYRFWGNIYYLGSVENHQLVPSFQISIREIRAKPQK